MKSLLILSSLAIATLSTSDAFAQRAGCMNSSQRTSMPTSIGTTYTPGGSLTNPYLQNYYAQQRAYQQQQIYLQQQYLQVLQQENAIAERKAQERERKIAARQERKAAEQSKRDSAKAKASQSNQESRLAARK
jgi:hypothetical protein